MNSGLSMPFLDWVNKNQAREAAREVHYYQLNQSGKDFSFYRTNKDQHYI